MATTSRSCAEAGPALAPPGTHFWLWVLCLLGLDYFSTLAYQPSISYEVAGPLAPLATGLVVILTLGGALPVYCYLAGRSPAGAGSIGLLEHRLRGWRGKTLVLLLLGFAATDFTMLKTLSLADAAVHVLRSEDGAWQRQLTDLTEWLRATSVGHLGESVRDYFNEQLTVTLLLGALGFFFWYLLRHGFTRKVLVLAVPLVALYLALNAVLLGAGLFHLADHPELVRDWWHTVHHGPWGIEPPLGLEHSYLASTVLSLLFLPNLALGLSGFEMSMILMPQVKGRANEVPPRTRIASTRKVLVTAAVVMAVYLLASTLVTTLLIPRDQFALAGREGPASNRALAYLAHGGRLTTGADSLLPWTWFGSLYDLTTVVILTLAGSSVMTALGALLPQFLWRFGMEFRWSNKWGVLFILFALVNTAVTVYFQASVAAQRNAYASAVLVLITVACLVSARDVRAAQREVGRDTGWGAWLVRNYFRLVAWIFALVLFGVLVRSASGLVIAGLFLAALIGMSVLSRAFRSDEWRTVGFDFCDEQSKFLWDSLRLADFPILVPHRPGLHSRAMKEKQIREEHHLDPDVDVVFVEAEVDDPSNFYQRLLIEVIREEKRLVIRATRCVSVAHAIAAIALELSRDSKPPGVHFGWPEANLLAASWNYFAFGEGNIPWKVRELIHRAEPDPSRRPRVVVG